jgi:hypothetical protein
MDMVKKHPDYKWEIGKEKEYFLKALGELDRRLAHQDLRWIFENSTPVPRAKIGKKSKAQKKKEKQEQGDMNSLVHEAFTCTSNSNSYNAWKKYFV